MQITRKSAITGITRTMEIPVTEEQLQVWEKGKHIQFAMPHLSADQREFIISGITQNEWAAFITEDDD
jgi:hypothetical protein